MNKKLKTTLIWAGLLAVLLLFVLVDSSGTHHRFEDFETFQRDIDLDRVAAVRVNNNEIAVSLHDADEAYTTLGVMDDELTQQLSEHGVVVTWGEPKRPLRTLLVVGVPLIVLLALLVFFVKKAGAGTTSVLSLTKSRARLISESQHVTFADVGGCTEAKDLLGDVIDFLKTPKRWVDAGARLPRGVLLEGPPGCGKTLLARAVAGETNAHFYLVSASEFVEMFVGVGAARVRDMFETAKKEAPSVIFIDELDAVGRRRGSGIGAGHDEREQTLNQLLVCLDGFETSDRVVVIGATNRPDILDKALLRPGRFDRRIRIPELTREARIQVLEIQTRNKPLAEEISLEKLADRTAGYTGAQLETLANEATLLAVRRSRKANDQSPVVLMEDFDQALQPGGSKPLQFDKLDSLLIESAAQLAEPTGTANVRCILRDDSCVQGQVLWADGAYIKLRQAEDGSETIVPKIQVRTMEATEGTEVAESEDVVLDAWAVQVPDLA